MSLTSPSNDDDIAPLLPGTQEPAAASPAQATRLAPGGVLQRLETMAQAELARLAARPPTTRPIDDPMLAGLAWDLGLCGRDALRGED